MNKVKNLLFLYLITLSNLAFGVDYDRICEELDKLASISSSLTYFPFKGVSVLPNGQPVPTFLLAPFQTRNVYLELCRLHQKMKNLNIDDAARVAIGAGDEIFGTKMGDKLEVYDEAMSFKGAMERSNKLSSNSLDRLTTMGSRINAVLGKTNKFIEEKTGKKSDLFASKFEKSQQMGKMLRAQKRVSLLNDLHKCDSEISSYGNSKYSLDTSSQSEEISFLDQDIDLLYSTIGDMMIFLETNYERYDLFLSEINEIMNSFVTFDSRMDFYRRESKTFDKVDGKQVGRNKSIKTEYQVVSIKKNEEMFNRFRKKYAEAWADLKLRSIGSTPVKGMLTRDLGGHIDRDFEVKNFECRYSKIYRDLKEKEPNLFVLEDDPERDQKIRESKEECLKSGHENPENLMLYYIDSLGESLERSKSLQAEVWTIDSYYNGSVRVFEVGTVTNDLGKEMQREQVMCSRTLTQLELEKNRLDQKNVENEIRANLLEEKVKRTNLLQDRIREKELQNKIEERRRATDEAAQKRLSREAESIINPGVMNRSGL